MRDAAYVQLNNFPDHIGKKDFHIYEPVTICNFSEKLAQDKYICVGSYNISSLVDISCRLHFLKSFRNTAYVELLNFQDCPKSNFDSYYVKIQSLNFPEKVAGNHKMCERS